MAITEEQLLTAFFTAHNRYFFLKKIQDIFAMTLYIVYTKYHAEIMTQHKKKESKCCASAHFNHTSKHSGNLILIIELSLFYCCV